MVEKKKFSRRLTAALRTTRIGQDVVPPRYALPEIVVGCFFDTGGGIMRRPNGTDNLNKLAGSYHAPTTFYFFSFFYKYQNTPNPTRNLQKKLESKRRQYPKDKNICFKIQGYFDKLIMLYNTLEFSHVLIQDKKSLVICQTQYALV